MICLYCNNTIINSNYVDYKKFFRVKCEHCNRTFLSAKKPSIVIENDKFCKFNNKITHNKRFINILVNVQNFHIFEDFEHFLTKNNVNYRLKLSKVTNSRYYYLNDGKIIRFSDHSTPLQYDRNIIHKNDFFDYVLNIINLHLNN